AKEECAFMTTPFWQRVAMLVRQVLVPHLPRFDGALVQCGTKFVWPKNAALSTTTSIPQLRPNSVESFLTHRIRGGRLPNTGSATCHRLFPDSSIGLDELTVFTLPRAHPAGPFFEGRL